LNDEDLLWTFLLSKNRESEVKSKRSANSRQSQKSDVYYKL
jgi:hypothetical protein